MNLCGQRQFRYSGAAFDCRREGLFAEFVPFANGPGGTPRYENTMQCAIQKSDLFIKRPAAATEPEDAKCY
jgi:hypothetical protein